MTSLQLPSWQKQHQTMEAASRLPEEPSPGARASSRGFRWSSMAWEVAASEISGSETAGGSSSSRCSSASASPTHRISWTAPWVTPERSIDQMSEEAAATVLQAYWKGTMVRRLHRKRFLAAGLVVAHLRAWHLGREERKEFLRWRCAVVLLQRRWRRYRPREHEQELIASESVLVSCEVSPNEVMAKETELPSTPTKPGVLLRPALRGAARRKLLGEEVPLHGPKSCYGVGLRSPERRKPRKSGGSLCQLQSPEKKTTSTSESLPVSQRAVEALPSPVKEVLPAQPRLDSGALVLSELLVQGLLEEQPLDSSKDESIDGSLMFALNEIRASGVRVRFVARICRPSTALAAAYAAARDTGMGPERLLWHGTSWECVPNIVRHGFNRAYAFNPRHGSKLGRGVYFAEDPGYAVRFAGKTQTRALLLAGVLPGKHTRGKEGLLEPPADSRGLRFDSTCDDVKRPRVFCVFKDFQALPLYLIQVTV